MKAYTAWHVGRRGEVAGGMTQVVNGYLGWEFDEFDTRVISSRDGSTGLRAVRVAAAAVGRMLRLRDRDRVVVVVHLSQGGSFLREGLLLRIAHRRGFATIAQLHGSLFAAFAEARPRLVGGILRTADLVLTLTEDTGAVARRFVPDDRVILVPNAVPVGEPRQKEKLVVFGGAVSRRKGVDVLVAAWRELAERDPDLGWRLLVAGPTIDQEVVPDSLAAAEFLGPTDHGTLMGLLDRSSIAVLPSRDEAMPMFLLEAMARANCIVSTTVGAIPAVLADQAGLLVAPGDPAALRDALDRAMTDDAFRSESAARATAAFDADYSAAAVFPRIERVWKSTITARALDRVLQD